MVKKLKDYITVISDYFGLGSFPFEDNQEKNTANPTERMFELNRRIIADLEDVLKMQFAQQLEKGNVCFARHNSELQDDFKQVFTQKDVLNYFYAYLHTSEFQETELEKTYPKTTQDFWNEVRIGEKLRSKNLTQKKCES